MPKITSSTKGWRPHAVYELLDINRQTLFYWRDSIYPKDDQKYFSTYEILIFLIIKTYINEYGTQLTRLREVDWPAILKELKELTFSGIEDVILNIDLRDHTFKFYTNASDIDLTDRQNSFIYLGQVYSKLLNKIQNFGNHVP